MIVKDTAGGSGEDEDLTSREVELKLELEPGSGEALLSHPLLRDRIGESQQSCSVYYDTRKSSLRNAGVTLRVRRTGNAFVQTVKAVARGAAGMFDRHEWEDRISGPEPDLDSAAIRIDQLKRAGIRNRLRPVFETIVNRRAATLQRNGTVVELVLDQGEVVAGKRRQPLAEVELELLKGSRSALFEIARELHESVPLRLGVLTKSERGERLASGKGGRAMKAEPIRLGADMTAGQAFQTIAFACIRHFRVNEPLVIAAHDIDALHQSRVALRRLRSSFSVFRPILAPDAARQFKDELRTLASKLGDARNLDVLIQRRGEELTRKSRRALIDRRGWAYDRAVEALRSPDARTMMIDLAEWLALGSFAEWHGAHEADRPVVPFSADTLDRFWKKVKRRGKHLTELDEDARHKLRIAAKKLRYSGEFFAQLYASETQIPRRNAFLAEMETLQDMLGALNDLVTERALERDLRKLDIMLPASKRDSAQDREAVDALLAQAEASFARLQTIGPFWR
ncbi:MAG: CHAD domain-containing protein [Sphingomonadales bacterium]